MKIDDKKLWASIIGSCRESKNTTIRAIGNKIDKAFKAQGYAYHLGDFVQVNQPLVGVDEKRDMVDYDYEQIRKRGVNIFPELVESEDERIRKEITGFLNIYRGNGTWIAIPDVTKWIAWLEKVGNIIKEWGDLKVRYIQDDLQEMVDLKQKTEQGEQKPAWSDKDENAITWIKCICNDFVKSYKISPASTKVVQERVDKIENWLKSLKERVLPQPKQEWSEEDEQYLEDTLNLLEGHRSKNTYGDVVEWLKSLSPQNRWKPSDEQMKCLKEACDEHWEPDGLDPLYTLYQDLKKL